jgi:hypothetical protein
VKPQRGGTVPKQQRKSKSTIKMKKRIKSLSKMRSKRGVLSLGTPLPGLLLSYSYS